MNYKKMRTASMLASMALATSITWSCANHESRLEHVEIENQLPAANQTQETQVQAIGNNPMELYDSIKKHVDFSESAMLLMISGELEKRIPLPGGAIITKFRTWEKSNDPGKPVKVFVDFEDKTWGTIDYTGEGVTYSGLRGSDLERNMATMLNSLR